MNYFYTIMINDKFINSNFMREPNNNICQAIRFNTIEEAKEYCQFIIDGVDYKIIKVNCSLEVIN